MACIPSWDVDRILGIHENSKSNYPELIVGIKTMKGILSNTTMQDSPRPSAAEIRKGAYWRRKGEEEPTVDCEGELPVGACFTLKEDLF